jgi:hypothetical protein
MNIDEFTLDKIRTDVIAAWSKFHAPAGDELFEKDDTAEYEQKTLRLWLNRKTIDQLDDGKYIETECPFFYLSSKASSYYSGAYILKVLDNIKSLAIGSSLCPSFGALHFFSYLSSGKFQTDSKDFTKDQKQSLEQLMRVMRDLRSDEDFGLDDDEFRKALKNASS